MCIRPTQPFHSQEWQNTHLFVLLNGPMASLHHTQGATDTWRRGCGRLCRPSWTQVVSRDVFVLHCHPGCWKSILRSGAKPQESISWMHTSVWTCRGPTATTTPDMPKCIYYQSYMVSHIWSVIYGQSYTVSHIRSVIYGQSYTVSHITYMNTYLRMRLNIWDVDLKDPSFLKSTVNAGLCWTKYSITQKCAKYSVPSYFSFVWGLVQRAKNSPRIRLFAKICNRTTLDNAVHL